MIFFETDPVKLNNYENNSGVKSCTRMIWNLQCQSVLLDTSTTLSLIIIDFLKIIIFSGVTTVSDDTRIYFSKYTCIHSVSDDPVNTINFRSFLYMISFFNYFRNYLIYLGQFLLKKTLNFGSSSPIQTLKNMELIYVYISEWKCRTSITIDLILSHINS